MKDLNDLNRPRRGSHRSAAHPILKDLNCPLECIAAIVKELNCSAEEGRRTAFTVGSDDDREGTELYRRAPAADPHHQGSIASAANNSTRYRIDTANSDFAHLRSLPSRRP